MRALLFALTLLGCLGCLSLPSIDQHRFACDGGAGQCPGDWVCSLADQSCHDPDAGNYACLTNQDCGGVFQCSVSLDGGPTTCHAPVPGSYPCLTSANCDGWQCSQADHTCHDPDAGGYACDSNADCSYPFACGLGTCANLANDEIDLTLAPVCLDAGTRVSPVLGGPPDLFEMGEPYLLATPHGAIPSQNLAWSANGALQMLLATPQGIQEGNSGNQAYVQTFTVAQTTASAMGLIGGTLAWSDSNGLHTFVLNAGGSQVTGQIQNVSGFTAKAFRASPFASMFAFGDSSFVYLLVDSNPNDGDAGSVSGSSPQTLGTATLIDMVETSGGAVAATDQGLFVASYTPPNNPTSPVFSWQPLQAEAIFDGGYWAFVNGACAPGDVIGAPTLLTPEALYPGQATNPSGLDNLLIKATAPDGTVLMTQLHGGSGCQPLTGTEITPPCPPCPDGGYVQVASLNEFFFNGLDYIDEPVARCRDLTGPVPQEQVFEIVAPDPTRTDRTVCQWETPEGYGLPHIEADLSVSQTSDPTRGGLAGFHGQLWTTPDAGFDTQTGLSQGGLTTIQSLLLAQPPDFYGNVVFGPYNFDVVTTGATPWLLTTGVGYAPGVFGGQGIEPLAVVDGQSSWFVLEGNPADEVWDTRGNFGMNHLPPVIISLDPSREGQRPVHATLAQTADGGTLLLATEFDAFMAGDVTALAPGQSQPPPVETPVSISIVALPEVEVPIEALAAVNPPREGFAEAYLLTSLEVVHLQALGPIRWTQEVLTPPSDPTPLLDLWTDGDRARLGFGSGVVYALPTDVQLSQPIPGTLPVLSYAHAGQTTFAVTGQDIYRLTPVGAGMPATWTSLGAETGLSGASFAGARVFTATGSLAVFNQYGQSFQIPIDSPCP
jgi:hypothetical protein